MQNLTRKIVVSLILALVVFGGLAFYADAPRLFQALGRFDWRYLPLALAATLVNYMVRFGRWHYYLHILGIRDVQPRGVLTGLGRRLPRLYE